jgi:acyl carrier protein
MSLNEIVARVLSVPADQLTDESDPTTVGSWNSLRHIELIVQVETAYGLKFSRSEMVGLRSVGQIRAMLLKKGVQESELYPA